MFEGLLMKRGANIPTLLRVGAPSIILIFILILSLSINLLLFNSLKNLSVFYNHNCPTSNFRDLKSINRHSRIQHAAVFPGTSLSSKISFSSKNSSNRPNAY
jgi:hypothetical protein